MRGVYIGIILALIGLIIYLNWFSPVRLPEGKVLVNKSYLDSLFKVSQTPPDTLVRIDTFWKPKPVYVHDSPPKPKDSTETAFIYEDSLRTSELFFYLRDSISRKGIILDRKKSYRLFVPFQVTKEITITKPVPMPFETIKEVKLNYKYYGQVGYNFMHGGLIGELGIVRGRFMIGAEGGKNLAGVKIGILF